MSRDPDILLVKFENDIQILYVGGTRYISKSGRSDFVPERYEMFYDSETDSSIEMSDIPGDYDHIIMEYGEPYYVCVNGDVLVNKHN